MLTVETIRAALADHGCRPHRNGDGIKALCPCCQTGDNQKHEPALSVKAGTAAPLVYCHASRCAFEIILGALGIESPAPRVAPAQAPKRRTAPAGGPPPDPEPEESPDAKATRCADALWESPHAARLAYLERDRGLSRAVILGAALGFDAERECLTIPVLDASGAVLYIREHRPSGSPKYKSPPGAEAALYGADTLTGLEDGALVLVCEGELDALRARTLGYNAVSGTAGAKTWRDEWSKALARFEVIVCGDADPDGDEMRRKVPASIRKAGGYAQPLAWPEGAPKGEDVTSFTLATPDGPERFRALVDAALSAGNLRSIDLAAALTAPPEPIPWIVAGWLARGEVACIAGDGGVGKSWLSLSLALGLARPDGRFLGMPIQGGPFRVMVLDEEQSERLVSYRLRKLAHGLGISADDVSRLPIRYCINNLLNLDDPERLQSLYREIRRFRPDVILGDSMVRLHGRDENSNQQMAGFFREVIRPIVIRFGVTVGMVHHLGKPGENRKALGTRLRGASDVRNQVDQLWGIERAGDRLTMIHDKCRDAAESADLSLTISDTDDGLGVILAAREADSEADDVLLAALSNAGPAGVLREDLIEAVDAAKVTADPKKTTTRRLGKLHADQRVKRASERQKRRYWTTAYAPESAE